MLSNDFKIYSKECNRLNDLRIPYRYVHISDGKPIVIVDGDVLKEIMAQRDSGRDIPGIYISDNNGKWSASIIDKSGTHVHRSGLTECRAYRWALGYPIGETKRNSHYAGQGPYRRTYSKRKRAHKP